MPEIQGSSSAAGQPTSEAFRHLPDGVALEDTVASVVSDGAFASADERNAFIEAALQAGG